MLNIRPGLTLSLSYLIWLASATAALDPVIHEHKEGDHVAINCNNTTNQDDDINWSQDDSLAVYQSGPVLQITHISRNDSGNYTCIGTNKTHPEHNRTLQVVTLKVLYPAVIKELTVEPSVASENGTFDISCSVDGNPRPTWEIRFQKTNWNDDRLVYSSNGSDSTRINVTARCGDDGVFVCVANNTLNTVMAKMNRSADVLCVPRLDPAKKTVNVQYSSLGSSAVFMELVLGYPAPNYTLSRDDGRPPRNVEIRTFTSFASFRFKDVQIADYGNYTLVMNNSMGRSSVDLALLPRQLDAPLPPYNLTYSNVTSSSVYLRWTSDFDMGGPMYFRCLRYDVVFKYWRELPGRASGPYENHGIGQHWSYNLTGLEQGTHYYLAVDARKSSFVASDVSNYVIFNTTVAVTPPPPPPMSFNAGLSWGAIIGIIVSSGGAAAFLFGVALIVLVRHFRFKSNQKSRGLMQL